MKCFFSWMTLLCFATHAFAANFEALDNSETGKYFVGNHQEAAYTVPKGTLGKVKFITDLPAHNNRTGEHDSYLGIQIEKIGPGVKTGLKVGMVILVYYSAEKSRQVMKLTDDRGRTVKNAKDAKSGIAKRDFDMGVDSIKLKPEPKIKEKADLKPAPAACVTGGLDAKNKKNIHHALTCLTQNIHDERPPSPKRNDPVENEILTYVNNFVWNDIQNDARFNKHKIKNIEERRRLRRAEYDRREKINEVIALSLLKNARKQNLDESIMVGMAQTESKFDPNLCSKMHACGLFQLLLSTAKQYSGNPKLTEKDLKNIEINTTIGATMIRALDDKYCGDMDKLLTAYNAGEGNERKIAAGLMRMPTETANYHTRVLNSAMAYKASVAEAKEKLIASR